MILERQLTTFLTLLLATTAVFADDEAKGRVRSGLQVGETVTSFNVLDVTGPAKGTSICYACRFGVRPVVNVFVRELTPEVTQLIRKLDQLAAKHKDEQLKVFVVLLSIDPESDSKQLVQWNQKSKLNHAPLTIFDGITGPQKCRIAQHAAVTVMMWTDTKVKVNHAFTDGQLNADAVAAVLADVPQILE